MNFTATLFALAFVAPIGPQIALEAQSAESSLSARDTATIFIAAAAYLANSLPTWAPNRQVRLDIPEYPRDSALQASLRRSTAQTPYLLQCPDLVRCTDRRRNAVRLDSLRRLSADSVAIAVHFPPRGVTAWTGAPGLGWAWSEWAMAAANGLYLDMSPYIVGGCVDSGPYAIVVFRDDRGWQVGSVSRVLLCA